MSIEQVPVAPQALEAGILDRVEDFVTGKQMATLAKHLTAEGITGELNQQLTERQFETLGENVVASGVTKQFGDKTGEKPWTAMMDVVDEITFAASEPQRDGPPKSVDVTARLSSGQARDRFYDFYETLLSGVHGSDRPRIRTSPSRPKELDMTNILHPDVCTPGRVATALFLREFRDLGRNNRLIVQRSLDQIEASGVVAHMPPELVARMQTQRERLGVMAGGTLLTSGQFSLIGGTVRRSLVHTGPLDMQRPKRNRPAIEEGLSFKARAASADVGLPVSGTTIGHELQGQLIDRITDVYRKEDKVGTLERLASIIGGLGVTEGVGSAVKALGTVSTAFGAAMGSKVADMYLKRQLTKANSTL
ncbi:MAG TPA: hypothetical protein VLF62_03495 [Candidatus Saccharimonadales bacterium]|nr:hypothetical protein [Candidatus Saccharimonadales bacterium]